MRLLSYDLQIVAEYWPKHKAIEKQRSNETPQLYDVRPNKVGSVVIKREHEARERLPNVA